MKKVYAIWNYDTDEVLYASEDKQFLCEILYDCVMEEAYSTYFYEYLVYNYKTPAAIEDLIQEVFEYFADYINIIEIPLI